MYEGVNDVIGADICSPLGELDRSFCLNRVGRIKEPRWCSILAVVALQQHQKSENI